jgi:hypothetical protein
MTVVNGRRSGDVWISNGDAVDGKTKITRALRMLAPTPKLSVLPPEEALQDSKSTPPLLMQLEDSPVPVTLPNTLHLETSADFGRIRKNSKASSHYYSGGNESLAYALQIMIAQRHYSTPAHQPSMPSSTNTLRSLRAPPNGASRSAGRHCTSIALSSCPVPQPALTSPWPSSSACASGAKHHTLPPPANTPTLSSPDPQRSTARRPNT